MPLLLVTILAAGCGDGGDDEGTAELQRELAAQDRVQTALRERIEELESQVQALLVGATEPEEDPLADLDERLAAVEGTLEGLSTRIDEEVAGRAELGDQLDEVRSTLTGVQSAVGGLQDELQLLREDLEALRRRFEGHDH